MPTDPAPHAAPAPLHDMLGAAVRLLEDDILPRLQGTPALRLRMLIRQLHIGQRELRQGPALREQEAQRLSALIGPFADLAEGRLRLALAVRERRVEADARALRDHVQLSTDEVLAIDHPDWARPRPAGALSHRTTTGDKP